MIKFLISFWFIELPQKNNLKPTKKNHPKAEKLNLKESQKKSSA
jgi:hypothetical protein